MSQATSHIFDLAAAVLSRLQHATTPAKLVAAFDEGLDSLEGVEDRYELDWSQSAKLTFAVSRAYRDRLDSLQSAGMAAEDWQAHLASIKPDQLDAASTEQWVAPSPARPCSNPRCGRPAAPFGCFCPRCYGGVLHPEGLPLLPGNPDDPYRAFNAEADAAILDQKMPHPSAVESYVLEHTKAWDDEAWDRLEQYATLGDADE